MLDNPSLCYQDPGRLTGEPKILTAPGVRFEDVKAACQLRRSGYLLQRRFRTNGHGCGQSFVITIDQEYFTNPLFRAPPLSIAGNAR